MNDNRTTIMVEGLDIIIADSDGINYCHRICLTKVQAQSLRDDLNMAIENVINREFQAKEKPRGR